MTEMITNERFLDCVEKSMIKESNCREYRCNQNKSYLIVKRIFDIISSSVAGVLLLLPLIILVIIIRIESPGPAIYSQERIGKDGKPFTMYKFRSMYLDSEKNGPQWAAKNDQRCTRIGKIIRVFHIDELPQLWNVFIGDMSIVGPRPERAYFYEIFKERVPDFEARLKVLPGLTCIAQINGCYDLLPEERFAYDVEYMEKQSVGTDLLCILKTFPVIVSRKGAR